MRNKSLFLWWRRCPTVGLLVLLLGPALRADVLFAWNEAMLQFCAAAREPLAPHLEARSFAVAHLAMEEAVLAAASPGDAAAQLTAQRAAVVCAALDVLASTMPAGAPRFQILAERHLAALPEGAAKARGISAGRAAAARWLQRRAQDGWAELARDDAPLGPRPDTSEATASALARGEKGLASPWLAAAPFALESAGQFPVAEVQVLQRDGTMAVDYALVHGKLFNGVDRVNAVKSPAGSWTQSALVTWNRIARQVSVGRLPELQRQASLLAALNVALADATLAALHAGHTVGSWRATSTDMWYRLNGAAPRATDVLARIDEGVEYDLARREMRRVLIPPTSNYPSLAATLAGAAQASLLRFFKTDALPFTLPVPPHQAGPAGVESNVPRMFPTVSAAAREAAFLSTLDGRHSREACLAGHALGASVGNYVAKRSAAARR